MYDDLFNKLKKTNEFITKEQIYALYDQVSKEIESGMKDNGVWTKAYADARGDLEAAKGIYIELMVERYVLAGEAQQEAINRNQKNKRKKELKKKIDTATERVKEYINESLAPPPKMKYDNLFGILAIIYSGLILFLTGYGEDWDFSRFSTSGVFGRVIFLIVVATSSKS